MAQRRKRNLTLHYSAIAMIVLIIFSILSTTVLFNIETAFVTGSSIYSVEEIIRVSGIQGGDNMIRKNLGKAEQSIVSELIYIETAEISRKLPSSVEILVTPCTETASLESEDGFIIVSGAGKILRMSEEPAEGTQIFYGAEPAEGLETGMEFASADEGKTEVIFGLMSRSGNPLAGKITSFDVSDRLNISCVYDGRIEIELGVITDVDYKFKFANEILTTKISPDAEGRLKMFGDEAQFLSKSDLEQIEETFKFNSEHQTMQSETTVPSEIAAETVSDTNTSTKLNFE